MISKADQYHEPWPWARQVRSLRWAGSVVAARADTVRTLLDWVVDEALRRLTSSHRQRRRWRDWRPGGGSLAELVASANDSAAVA